MHRLTLREVAGRMGRGGGALCLPLGQPTSWGRGRTWLTLGPLVGVRLALAVTSARADAELRSAARAARGPLGSAASRARLAPLAARPEWWSMPPREMTQKGPCPFWVILGHRRTAAHAGPVNSRQPSFGRWSAAHAGPSLVRAIRSLRSLRAAQGGPYIKALAHLAKWATGLMRTCPLRRFSSKWAGCLMQKGPNGPTFIKVAAHLAKWAAGLMGHRGQGRMTHRRHKKGPLLGRGPGLALRCWRCGYSIPRTSGSRA